MENTNIANPVQGIYAIIHEALHTRKLQILKICISYYSLLCLQRNTFIQLSLIWKIQLLNTWLLVKYFLITVSFWKYRVLSGMKLNSVNNPSILEIYICQRFAFKWIIRKVNSFIKLTMAKLFLCVLINEK